MFIMILQMSGATAMYVVLTVLLWRLWNRKPAHSIWERLGVGLIYGLCSILSNHISINYGNMLLNVRDIGPLVAGLFFDPLAGILSGVLGGVERFIIGEYYGIGTFTRVACGLSTCLAGLISATLHWFVFKGKRPSVSHSFFLGAVMEVFHMYAVLLTHRDEMYAAYQVVRVCALPMITFTGLGVALCSGIILHLSGKEGAVYPWTPREETPIHVRIQRWLLVVVIGVFILSSALTTGFQIQMAYQNAASVLEEERDEFRRRFEEGKTMEAFLSQNLEVFAHSNIQYYIVDARNNTIASLQYVDEPMHLEAQELDRILSGAGEKAYRGIICHDISVESICASARLNTRYSLLLCTPVSLVVDNEDRLYEMLFTEILSFTTLYLLVALLVRKMVVRNLEQVNRSLNRITEGDLEETVDVRESSEFTELSGKINQTVTALRGYIDAEKKRMAAELKLAATIQESALPKVFTFPRNDFEIHALMYPAKQVGGDFYDFFFVDADRLALVIADVSGKGVPAALFMMRAKTAVKNYAKSGHSPSEVLFNANNVLCEGNDAEMFVTVWIGIIDLNTGLMTCANAGHEYPMLMRAGGGYELFKDRHGLPLAAMENGRVKEYELQLNPGDKLLVYTDGVPEAIDEQENGYGTDRMLKQANEVRKADQKGILEGVLQGVRQFAGKAEQFDDITMIGFSYFGPEKK